ncbi:MAG: dicarboxylate/amino acid:cation symporter [Cytophagales bacterium]|nr:dicarboxylate/amino acid:cation symporter [Cytophagales bacterium]
MIERGFKELSEFSHHLQRLLETKLWLKILVGMFLGILVGLLIMPDTGFIKKDWADGLSSWLGFPGTLFIKLVQMIMIPLVFTSIITGIASNTDTEKLKKVGLYLVLYFVSTTAIAIVIGTGFTSLIQPGNYFTPDEPLEIVGQTQKTVGLPSISSLPTIISELLPSNPLESMVSGEMLSIVIFTLIIGIAITFMERKNVGLLLDLLSSVQEICMTIVRWAMELAPYAVFGLMAQLVINVGLKSILGLGVFMLTVLLGLAVLMAVYLVIIALLGKRNPLEFLRLVRDVQLLAFSTASSAAVMPLSMKTAEEKLNISPFISKFIVPIGATINMDGTALFQCAAVIFISQVYGMDLPLATIVLIMITVIAASIGTPSIPGGGIIILVTVLEQSGIPAEGIMILIGIDRILGMFRTAVNVTGDLTACVVFDRFSESGH